MLVLHPSSQPHVQNTVHTHNGVRFINDPQAICRYFAVQWGAGLPL